MIKETIKKIPLIGKVASKIYQMVKGQPHFESSDKYWKDRYDMGGNSGAGSYNELAKFKGEIINDMVTRYDINTVIEFGCGDGNQLKYFSFKKYLGFDVSQKAISICKKLYENDTSKKFEILESYTHQAADLTLSLDVIYHLIEDITFRNYMEMLFSSSKGVVIVYSSNTNENNNAVPHVRHRKFTEWVEAHRPDFKLVKHVPNKFPFNGDGKSTSFADFYIYKKQ